MKLFLSSYWCYLFLITFGLWANKPIIDWYAWKEPTTPASYERPDFIFMNSGKNCIHSGKYSDVLLLSDWTLFEVDQKRAEGYKKIIGFITEPTFSMDRLLDPMKNWPYSWIERNLHKFDLILTFNKYLLDKYPDKCKFLHAVGFGTLYHHGIHEKSQLCSHMVSDQQLTEGHKLRWAVGDKYRDFFDACKDGNSPWSEWKDPWLNPFCFSVIVENSRESHYFSEKIIECFRAGTVPIYWGCPTIGEFFDTDGIITFNNLEELEPILKSLSFQEYQKRLPSIRRNFELAEKYPQFRLGPCRHKPIVLVNPECTWEYSATRPDVFDGIWPYIKSYFDSDSQIQEEEIVSYNLVDAEPDIYITKTTEKIGCTWERGTVWEKHLIKTFYSLLKTKKEASFTVLDVGAQTGCFTLLAKFFPQSHWVAFEPITEAAKELKNNLKINSIPNVSVQEVAVSHSSGEGFLKLPKGNGHWGLSTMGNQPLRFGAYEERKIDCITLDEFIKEKGMGKIDFIKIDVEGWELNVLKGGEALIERDRPIILMEFNGTNMKQCGIKEEDIARFFSRHNYQFLLVSTEDILCIPQ